MLTTTHLLSALAAMASSAAAQQFVMYTPGGDDTSVQRMDAILSPGKIFQHVHQVFGSSAASPDMTYASLQEGDCTTVADASNHGNGQDNSVYWHPSLYMEAANGTGYVRVPTNGHKLYYKNAGSPKDQKASPFEFPEGFRMIAGNAFMRGAAVDIHRQNITQWICHANTGMNQGTDGGFPNHVTDCASVDGLNGAIHFPHCWNGQDFNQLAPDAHMSYPTGDIQEGVCPPSHPIRLPHIFMENTFDLHSVVDQVKPNTFVLSMGDPTGYGWHADFFNGWKSGAIPALLNSCPQGKYGNEDIGSCGTFQKSSVPADECKLTTTYVENVDTPQNNMLPGCNPISTVNPAPIMAAVALDIVTDICQLVGLNILDANGTMTVKPASGTTADTETNAESSSASDASIAASSSATTVPGSSSAAVTLSPIATTFATAVATSASVATVASTGQAVATGSVSSAISCPSANGTQYTASSGQTFEIECGVDHAAGDLDMTYVSNGLAGCIAACSATDGCVDVSLSGTACYLKNSLGAAIANAGILGAKLISSPASGSSSASASATSSAEAAVTSAPQLSNSKHITNNEHVGAAAEDENLVIETAYQTIVVTVTATPTPTSAQAIHARHLNAHRRRAHARSLEQF